MIHSENKWEQIEVFPKTRNANRDKSEKTCMSLWRGIGVGAKGVAEGDAIVAQ